MDGLYLAYGGQRLCRTSAIEFRHIKLNHSALYVSVMSSLGLNDNNRLIILLRISLNVLVKTEPHARPMLQVLARP